MVCVNENDIHGCRNEPCSGGSLGAGSAGRWRVDPHCCGVTVAASATGFTAPGMAELSVYEQALMRAGNGPHGRGPGSSRRFQRGGDHRGGAGRAVGGGEATAHCGTIVLCPARCAAGVINADLVSAVGLTLTQP